MWTRPLFSSLTLLAIGKVKALRNRLIFKNIARDTLAEGRLLRPFVFPQKSALVLDILLIISE